MANRSAILAALLLLASACTSSTTIVASAPAESAASSQAVLNWESEGCPEPAPLTVESSAALETDVGLAAESVAEEYGVPLDEAKRRLRLQQVLGERMAEVQRAEADRLARAAFEHEPVYAAVVTLTGAEPISETTREILCRTPELEVRLNAVFSQAELIRETNRLAALLADFGPDLNGFGPDKDQLRFTVVNDAARDRLDALLATLTDVPYSIESHGIPPLVLDPTIPFPLLDVTGKISFGAGLGGTLTIDGPCVYLNDSLIILPARETVWNAATGVLNTGMGDVRSGDQVTGGGSQFEGDLAMIDQPPDPSCRQTAIVFQASFGPVDPGTTPAPIPPGSAPGVPPEPPDAPRFELAPRNPQAGETFTAAFDPDNSRGGYFVLQRWDGVDWSAPVFQLESDANRPPSTIRIQGDYGGDDYGVGGPGPDTLLMPDDIEAGQWRLCTANAAVRICTQLTVDA